jgi:flagellar protein FliS
MIQSPLTAYKETRVKTASPGQLIVMLYNEAVKQCDTAIDLLKENTKTKPQYIEKINKAINKVQDIVTELMASLDFEAGGDIAKDLFSLYVFFNRELMEANIAKDVKRIGAIRTMLDDLRQAWVQAAAQTQGAGGEGQSGVNIAG